MTSVLRLYSEPILTNVELRPYGSINLSRTVSVPALCFLPVNGTVDGVRRKTGRSVADSSCRNESAFHLHAHRSAFRPRCALLTDPRDTVQIIRNRASWARLAEATFGRLLMTRDKASMKASVLRFEEIDVDGKRYDHDIVNDASKVKEAQEERLEVVPRRLRAYAAVG
jgi:hypothetical protein